MRKKLIYIFLAAGVLSSCAKDDSDVGKGNESPMTEMVPISVSASIESTSGTKSNMVHDLQDIINSGNSLSLYSYAHFGGDDSPVSILENAKLSYEGGGWTYNPVQYWMESADDYHFSAVYPFLQGRLSPSFEYPTAADAYVLSLQPSVYPIYEKWSAEDYAQGNIIYNMTTTLYLTNPTQDVMFGDAMAYPAQFGNNVDIDLKHAACAVRFRIRNLSEKPFALTNWYMTGLKNHADMVIYIIGCEEQYDPLRYMTIVTDSRINELRITSFGQTGAKDSVKFAGDSHWTLCADAGVAPGNDEYYKYVMLSSRLKEVGKTYNLSWTHSEDGLTVTYSDGSGTTWTDPKEFMNSSQGYKDAVAAVKALYSGLTHYKEQIFWGPAHNLDVDNFFMPLVYERGAQITDFNRNQTRGDSGDYDLKIHQFECRSHMFQQSVGVWKANGGLYLPVNGDNYANLYSPYFFSAEAHTSIQGDWKEGMETTRWSETDPNYNQNEDGKQRSVFLWTADNSNPTTPLLLNTCITHSAAGDKVYSPSVQGGDLANVLDDKGYILMYPQTVENLEFNFFVAQDKNATGNPATASYDTAPSCHKFKVKNYTPDGEWRSGYTYDYIITVSTSAITMKLDVQPWNEREINLD